MVEPLRHRQTKGAANRHARPTATAPHPDSHGHVPVKGSDLTIHRSALIVCFGIQVWARFHDQVVHTRSNSHTVAARSGCTNIPRSTGGGSESETILYLGCLGHVGSRFAALDPSELIRPWGWGVVLRSPLCAQAPFMRAPSMMTPRVAYFQRATSSLRASATMVVLRIRPPLRWTRS
jgi:hypothetical protein